MDTAQPRWQLAVLQQKSIFPIDHNDQRDVYETDRTPRTANNANH